MAREKSPAYQRYPKDYLNDENVVAMTLEEEGAYNRLMDYCWLEGSIPADLKRLAALCKNVPPKRMQTIWMSIGKCFRPHPDRPDRLVHPRLEKERMKRAEYLAKSSQGGTRSARLRAARIRGTHTHYEWLALLAGVNGVCPRCNEPTDVFHKDHVRPIYMGGSDSIDNIQPLCPSCNHAKGAETIDYIAEHREGWLKGGASTLARPLQPKSNTSSSVSSLRKQTDTSFQDVKRKGDLTSIGQIVGKILPQDGTHG